MTTVPLTSPYSLKACTLAIASDDFTAALSQVQFDPSASATTWRGIGGNVVKDAPPADWTASLALAQDLAPGGLLRYLLDHEGEVKDVEFRPRGDGPTITATVTILPATIGGQADGTIATATVQLPVTGRPQFADAAPAPVIASATPAGAGEGEQVVIRGTSLTGATAVTFGGEEAAAFTVVDAWTIVAVLAEGAAGSAPITVTTPTGSHAAFPYTRA